MSLIGFKRATIAVLDGTAPAIDKNVFVIEGKSNKGATKTAKISGLASEPTKTYGSDIAYYISSKGVGDVTAELSLIDLPHTVLSKVLGHKEKGGITMIGADTEAPECSLLLESETPQGDVVMFGFFKGKFSMQDIEFATKESKASELPEDKLVFAANAGDTAESKDQYLGKYIGKDQATVTKLKQLLKISA